MLFSSCNPTGQLVVSVSPATITVTLFKKASIGWEVTNQMNIPSNLWMTMEAQRASSVHRHSLQIMSECLNQIHGIRESDSMLTQHGFANQYDAEDQPIDYHSLPINGPWTPDILVDNIELGSASDPEVIEENHYEEIPDEIPPKYQKCDWVDEVTQLEWNAASTSTPGGNYEEIPEAAIVTSEGSASNPIILDSSDEEITNNAFIGTASNPIILDSNYEEIPDDVFTNEESSSLPLPNFTWVDETTQMGWYEENKENIPPHAPRKLKRSRACGVAPGRRLSFSDLIDAE